MAHFFKKKLGSGFAAVGRAVAPKHTPPRFESSHRQFYSL